MTEPPIREAMRSAPLPDEQAAEQRAWQLVGAAFEHDVKQQRRGRRPRRMARPALIFGVLFAVGAAALTPPGEALGEWISDAVRPARAPSKPALTSLPTGGRLLVTSSQGAWVVQRDGSKRRLGRYTEAGWSPGGLFVVATRGRQLVALEPGGAVRWTLARSAPVTRPAWSPDGFRIAYLSGSSLRAVAGDGTGDAPLTGEVAPVTPAWRPGAEHVLAYVNRLGTIVVRNGDTGNRLWRARTFGSPTRLLWSPDGAYLVVVSREGVDVFDGAGAPMIDRALPAGVQTGTATINPVNGTLALVRYRPTLDRSEVVTLPLDTGGGPIRSRPRRLFAGDGRFGDLAWSPDGRWLLLAWRDANQWLFIRSARVNKVQTISNVGRQFDPGGDAAAPFPRVSGWCCAQSPDSQP